MVAVARIPDAGAVSDAMTLRVAGENELRALAGTDLPSTEWLHIDQPMVTAFANLTGDEQWIHTDAERAKSGPFGTTVAHGFLTLSLLPRFWHEAVSVDGFRTAVNYGLNRVRFPAPLLVPSRVRAHLRVEEVREAGEAVQVLLHASIEREGGDKAVCLAQAVFRYYL